MLNIKKPVVLGIVASLALGIFAAVPVAHAEPVSNSYVLAGSDTLQDSANALTNGTNVSGAFVRTTAGGASLGNYDAFGSALIQTKPAGPFFVRPAGSGDGRNALIASINVSGTATWKGQTITGQVDIARSSSGPGSNANTAGLLAYVPYARDAVSYAFVGPAGDLGALTTAQLKSIYESNTDVTIGTTVVKPLIPQSASGTRTFFLGAIGVTTLGSTVKDTVTATVNTLPENDASVLTQVGQIVPFSAANWIAQSNRASGVNTIPADASVVLGNLNGIAPFTGTGTALVPNTAYYATSFGRDTYMIVEYARINSADTKYDAKLAALVNPANATSLTNFSSSPASSGAVKRKFGFLVASSTTVIRAYATI